MPGHKGYTFPLDNTEIPQTDDFNMPTGAYAKAQRQLSRVYSSRASFFLTIGATAGIKAMVLYAKISGRRIIAMRNSHISVINACCLYNVKLDIVEAEYDESRQMYNSPEAQIIHKINQTKGKYAVIITSPDYYGRCIDLRKIKKASVGKDVLLLCDEAHGAHFAFSKALPMSVGKYADMWVHGAHKTLGALTQGAFLHCAKGIDIKTIANILRTINTTSPSHLIAKTLEDSIDAMQISKWTKRAEECKKLRVKINTLKHIRCIDASWAQEMGYVDQDMCRVVIDAQEVGGGFALYRSLYKKYNIQLEMADFRYAVAIMTIYDAIDCDEWFFDALEDLDVKKGKTTIPKMPKAGKKIISIQKAWMKNVQYCKIKKCKGLVAAVPIGAYPPGTVLILPGEKITRKQIHYLCEIDKAGGAIFGVINNKIPVIRM